MGNHILAVTLLSLGSLCLELLDASRTDNLHLLELITVHAIELFQLLINLNTRDHDSATERASSGERIGTVRTIGQG